MSNREVYAAALAQARKLRIFNDRLVETMREAVATGALSQVEAQAVIGAAGIKACVIDPTHGEEKAA